MELENWFVEIVSRYGSSRSLIDKINFFAPIPKNFFEGFQSFVNKYPDKVDQIVELMKNDRFLEFFSKVFGYSRYLIGIVMDNPSILLNLEDFLGQSFDYDKVSEEFANLYDSFYNDKSSFLKGVREIRKREFFRIVSREIVRLSDFEEVGRDLSLLADLVIEFILRYNMRNLINNYGEPSSGFCVISLGKLGGMELNYSSDIDVIFVYEKDGKTSKGIDNVEFFDKLARDLIYDISSGISGEFIYRVDTRLRPDGEFGALVRSEQSYYDYYIERGQTWELQMLIKARCSGGDKKLGERFVNKIKSIVYSTPLTDSEIAEILGIKQKIKGSEYDLKKTTGGIRDIEFIVQLLQLIFGAKEESLRVSNTLLALERLEEIKVIDKDIRRILEYSYKNLRRLENYIQLYSNLQDFSLPLKDKDKMIGLFRLLQVKSSYISGDEDSVLIRFVNDIKREVIKVKKYIFERLLSINVGEEYIFFLYNSEEEEVRELLKSYGLNETARAFSFIESMISSSFRGGVETSIGIRNLLRAVSQSPLPDSSLSKIYYILEATQNLPISVQFFTDERNVNFIFNVSLLKDVFINILRRRNWIWDGMMDTNAFMDYLPTLLDKLDFSENNYYERVKEVYEVFITSLAFLRINKFIDASKTKEVLSYMYDKIFYEFSRVLDGKLCVFALGRWANRKLTFFSDVDLIYILPFETFSDEFFGFRDRVISIHKSLSSIFDIDTRLVEGSHKGSFIISLKSFESTNLDIWQTIAYLKSRPVSYDNAFSTNVQNILISKLDESIRNMNFLELNNFVKKVISSFENTQDIKKGRGNLLELELVLDKLIFKNYSNLNEIPIAKSLTEIVKIVENFEKIDIPLRDYISLLVEVEDIMRIVEGIELDDKVFEIAGIPIKFQEFELLRKDVISWCNRVIDQQ